MSGLSLNCNSGMVFYDVGMGVEVGGWGVENDKTVKVCVLLSSVNHTLTLFFFKVRGVTFGLSTWLLNSLKLVVILSGLSLSCNWGMIFYDCWNGGCRGGVGWRMTKQLKGLCIIEQC